VVPIPRRGMNQAMGRWRLFLLAVVVLLAVMESTAAAHDADEDPAQLMQMIAEDGRRIMVTGLGLAVGDQFIDPENDLWVVLRVDGSEAVARLVERLPRLARPRVALAAVTPDVVGNVVLYHTHSDESYIIGDGTASIDGLGGIYQVGAALQEALEATGVTTVQMHENHNPRDHGAYLRSRRTALDALARHRPTLMLDVHRDAATAEEYLVELDGVETAQVMIVIGQSNPAHETNLIIARLLKDHADQIHPGLFRGIFLGRGVYNQDLYAQNLLLEVGSHEVPRAAAEHGIRLLADAVGPMLADLQQEVGAVSEEVNRRASWSILWLLVTVTGGAVGWLVLTSGGWEQAKERVAAWYQAVSGPPKRR
jgi:stage II sporulation protein P